MNTQANASPHLRQSRAAVDSQRHTADISPRACNTGKAADYLGVPKTTLKLSRTTGLLCGRPAPAYKKLERAVLYEYRTLDAWLDDLPEYANTAQAMGAQS